MKRRTKVLLLSTMTVMLCVLLITTGTFALFTGGINGREHLQAGTLDLLLQRRALRYAVLDADGYLAKKEDVTIFDFTERTQENVFGLGKNSLIVPQSYFEADMTLYNRGSVAFDYEVRLVWEKSNANRALAEQLRVCVDTDGNTATWERDCRLWDCADEDGFLLFSGRMDNTEARKKSDFTVRLEFLDSASASKMENNDAQGCAVSFDLIVAAVQHVKAEGSA